MKQIVTSQLAVLQGYAEHAAGVVAVLGSAIAFFPTRSGGWSQANVVTWLGAVAAMLFTVWLYVLAKCLWRDGHEVHAAIVIGLVLPVLGLGTRIVGGQRSFTISSVGDAIQLLYGGGFNLCIAAALVGSAILHAFLFPPLGRERRQHAL